MNIARKIFICYRIAQTQTKGKMMNVNRVVIVAIMSVQSFVQCMETKGGSFEDIAKAMKTVVEIKDKLGADNYASSIVQLNKAFENLTLATKPQQTTSSDQTILQKLQSEIAHLKQTQDEIHKDIVAMRKESTLTTGIVVAILRSKENAETIGNAIQDWVNLYYPPRRTDNNKKETFTNRVRTEKPLRSDIEYVQYDEQDVAVE